MAWYHASTPDNIKPAPWIHPAATAYLETLISRASVIIEHGCGGSSMWFRQLSDNVTSYEADTEWAQAVRARGCNVVNSDTPPDGEGIADILFIDGKSTYRPIWIKAAARLVRRGGWVVIDNSNRLQYAEAITGLFPHTGERMEFTSYIPEIDKTVSTLFLKVIR